MKNLIHGLFLYLSVLLIYGEAQAQHYQWQVVHPDSDALYSYWFSDISCTGPNCFAVGSRNGWLDENPIIPILLKSNDWGKTWTDITPVDSFLLEKGFSRVQRIDDQNIFVAGRKITSPGNIFFALSSRDGGLHWQQEQLPEVTTTLLDLHFSDSLTGICISYNGTQNRYYPFTTTDGGNTWQQRYIDSTVRYTACYSFGGGRFGIFGYWVTGSRNTHRIYDIFDFGGRIDSSEAVVTGRDTIFHKCTFSSSDTAIIYGYGSAFKGAFIRKIDYLENVWERPIVEIAEGINELRSMTNPTKDTIVGGGRTFYNRILFSFDRGRTWVLDTIPLPGNGTDIASIVKLDNGNILCTRQIDRSGKSELILGESVQSDVKYHSVDRFLLSVYPNPANEKISVFLPLGIEQITLVDAVGRTLNTYNLGARQNLEIITSTLPSGIYRLISRSASAPYSAQFIVAH